MTHWLNKVKEPIYTEQNKHRSCYITTHSMGQITELSPIFRNNSILRHYSSIQYRHLKCGRITRQTILCN